MIPEQQGDRQAQQHDGVCCIVIPGSQEHKQRESREVEDLVAQRVCARPQLRCHPEFAGAVTVEQVGDGGRNEEPQGDLKEPWMRTPAYLIHQCPGEEEKHQWNPDAREKSHQVESMRNVHMESGSRGGIFLVLLAASGYLL